MSVQNILRFTADLSRGVVMTPLRMAFIRGEDMGHCFLIQAEQEGKKLPLTGATVNGFMIRADGTTLTIAGTVADGLASLALPAAAYSVPGRFRLVIQSTLSGVTTTLFWGEGAVSPSYTDVVAIPEEIIVPSLENIEAQIERMKTATAAAEAAARGAVVRNLLDNSDFMNPVNQRGYVNGTAVSTYFIDRWRSSTNGSFTLDANGLTVSAAHCFQIVPTSKLKSGQTYTIACKMGGNILCYSGVYGNTIGVWESGLVATYDAQRGLIFYLTMTASAYEWAALYEGSYTVDTLPGYQPKGYAAELAECQRYYQQFGFDLSKSGVNATDGYPERIPIQFGTPMRIVPTVAMSKSWDSGLAKEAGADYITQSGMCFSIVGADTTAYVEWHGIIACSADL